MAILTARGPVHAPSLCWGAGGERPELSPRPPSEARPSSMRFNRTKRAAPPQEPDFIGTFAPRPRRLETVGKLKSLKSARPATTPRLTPAHSTHRLQVVNPDTCAPSPTSSAHVHVLTPTDVVRFFCSEKREWVSESAPYAPVYFALPRPATVRLVDKWDSARLLKRSRPASVVLRHVVERDLPPHKRMPRLPPSNTIAPLPLTDRPTNTDSSTVLPPPLPAATSYPTEEVPWHTGPNQAAFVVSASGRLTAGSRMCPRALTASQTGYTLGWVRRRSADEHAAAARIQALFHGQQVRKMLTGLHSCAMDIQARMRGRLARAYLNRVKGATGLIQAWYHGWKVRREYGAVLQAMRLARRERARKMASFVYTTSTIKPAARRIVGRMRDRKRALHNELRRRVRMRAFRRYATRALVQSREEKAEQLARAREEEWASVDDEEQIRLLLRDDSDGNVCLKETDKGGGWTLTWGNMVLSKAKVAELAAEVERLTLEWASGKIVRGDDGVFRASFDPGNDYADWLSKWLDPTHYSHGGRYQRTAHGPVECNLDEPDPFSDSPKPETALEMQPEPEPELEAEPSGTKTALKPESDPEVTQAQGLGIEKANDPRATVHSQDSEKTVRSSADTAVSARISVATSDPPAAKHATLDGDAAASESKETLDDAAASRTTTAEQEADALQLAFAAPGGELQEDANVASAPREASPTVRQSGSTSYRILMLNEPESTKSGGVHEPRAATTPVKSKDRLTQDRRSSRRSSRRRLGLRGSQRPVRAH